MSKQRHTPVHSDIVAKHGIAAVVMVTSTTPQLGKTARWSVNPKMLVSATEKKT